MKNPPKIKFRIDREGNIEFEIQGVKGSGCDQLAEKFAELGELELKDKTAEYYEKEVAQRLSSRTGR
jgi:hypothetical protein